MIPQSIVLVNENSADIKYSTSACMSAGTENFVSNHFVRVTFVYVMYIYYFNSLFFHM